MRQTVKIYLDRVDRETILHVTFNDNLDDRAQLTLSEEQTRELCQAADASNYKLSTTATYDKYADAAND